MKKTLAIAAALLSLAYPVNAQGEITTGASNKNFPLTVENNSVIDGAAQFDYVKYNAGISKNLNPTVLTERLNRDISPAPDFIRIKKYRLLTADMKEFS